jgi:hypothetical protein
MSEAPEAPKETPSPLEDILPIAIEVATDPRGFFSSMAREGGYEAPGIFAAVMLFAYGAILALFQLVHGHLGGVLFSLILIPLFGAIGLAIGAAIVLFISRALGGEASFESSFRIVAYSAALLPIAGVAFLIPYLPILVQAYQLYILIVAVIAVHKVGEQKAWTVLGGIGALLLFLSLLGTIAARRVGPKIDALGTRMQKQAEEMQKAAEQMRQQLEKQQQQQQQ